MKEHLHRVSFRTHVELPSAATPPDAGSAARAARAEEGCKGPEPSISKASSTELTAIPSPVKQQRPSNLRLMHTDIRLTSFCGFANSGTLDSSAVIYQFQNACRQGHPAWTRQKITTMYMRITYYCVRLGRCCGLVHVSSRQLATPV